MTAYWHYPEPDATYNGCVLGINAVDYTWATASPYTAIRVSGRAWYDNGTTSGVQKPVYLTASVYH